MSGRLAVLVVDDEPHARAGVRNLLAGDPDIDCIAECGDGPSAVEAIKARRPDIVILDVQMPGLDGFEVIEAVGHANMPVTVFVTAFERYAIRAFKVSAADYITKPFEDEAFFAAMGRAKRAARATSLERMQKQLETLLAELSSARNGDANHLTRLAVRHEGRTLLFSVSDVDWIEAADYYVKLHIGSATHLLRATLDSLETRLDPAHFFRLHRSAIVNLSRIRELRPTFRGEHVVLLHDGTRLRLPRRRRSLLATLLKQRI